MLFPKFEQRFHPGQRQLRKSRLLLARESKRRARRRERPEHARRLVGSAGECAARPIVGLQLAGARRAPGSSVNGQQAEAQNIESNLAGREKKADGHPPAATTGFRSTPSFSISTSTTSPGLRNTGGLRNAPTPSGVPVAMMSPGSKVMLAEVNSISSGTPKIILLVWESCIVMPFTRARMARAEGSGISSRVVRWGPVGQTVSHDLPRTHCLSPNCHTRAETSFSGM